MPDGTTEQGRLEDRLALFQISLNPAVLWPDVGRESLDAALREIARVTRELLGGGTASLAPPAAGDGVRALGVAGFISGMGPLLGYWVDRGQLDATPDQRTLLARHRDHGRRRHAMLQQQLAGVLESLQARDVTPIVLKGMDTARRYFPAPGTRTIGDIDLLVRPAELDRARAGLAAGGFIEQRRTARPFRSEWTRRGAAQHVRSLEIDHVDNPWAIDLHWTLERYYYRGLVASLGARAFDAVPLAVADRHALGLAQPVLTAWLAIHSGNRIDQLQLARLVELVFVIRRDTAAGVLSWEEVMALLHETRTTRFAYPALALVEDLAPGTVPREAILRGAGASSARARRVVRTLAESGAYRLGRRSFEEKLMWARGPVQLLLALSDLVWPGDQGGLLAAARLQLRRLRGVLAGHARLRADSRRP